MGRKKIVPMLQDFLGIHAPDEQAAPRLRGARRELRALLAVARAAKRHVDEEHYPHGAARNAATTDALWAALARLERAGKEER